MITAERRLEEAIKRIDPELTDYLRPDPAARARCASIIARAQLREARRRRVQPATKYVELLNAAAPWL